MLQFYCVNIKASNDIFIDQTQVQGSTGNQYNKKIKSELSGNLFGLFLKQLEKYKAWMFGFFMIVCVVLIYTRYNKKILLKIFVLAIAALVLSLMFCAFKKHKDNAGNFLCLFDILFLATFAPGPSLMTFWLLICSLLPVFTNKHSKNRKDIWFVGVFVFLMILTHCFLPEKIAIIVLWFLFLAMIFCLLYISNYISVKPKKCTSGARQVARQVDEVVRDYFKNYENKDPNPKLTNVKNILNEYYQLQKNNQNSEISI